MRLVFLLFLLVPILASADGFNGTYVAFQHIRFQLPEEVEINLSNEIKSIRSTYLDELPFYRISNGRLVDCGLCVETVDGMIVLREYSNNVSLRIIEIPGYIAGSLFLFDQYHYLQVTSSETDYLEYIEKIYLESYPE